METFLEVWDLVELWLVTLPFPLQLVIMLVMGIPLFLVLAFVVEKIADVSVDRFRALVASPAVENGKEVR